MKIDADTKRVLIAGVFVVLGGILVLSADMAMALTPDWKDIANLAMGFGLILVFIGAIIIYSTPVPSRK